MTDSTVGYFCEIKGRFHSAKMQNLFFFIFKQQFYTIYKYNPVCQDKGALKGSCQDFDTRKHINSEDVTNMTYDEVLEK